MNLIPLKKEQFECLRPLLTARLHESSLERETNVDFILVQLDALYERRAAGAYVDSIENPTCCLLVTHYQSLLSPIIVASINLIYIVPEKRGELALANSIVDAAETYAKANGAKAIYGSSWIYRGSDPTDSFWTRNKFEPREHTYIKHLN